MQLHLNLILISIQCRRIHSGLMKLRSVTLHAAPGLWVAGVDEEVDGPRDWSDLLRPGCAQVVLNLDGHGVVFGNSIRLTLVPGSLALLRTAEDERVHASRIPAGTRHRLVVVSASEAWLTAHFGLAVRHLHGVLQSPSEWGAQPQAYLRSMRLAERDLAESLLRSPVVRSLRGAWFQGKCLEVFCVSAAGEVAEAAVDETMQSRLDAAVSWLREHHREELDLKVLARHVGCAPHYLSRLFSQHSGKTLRQKLREIRVNRAAELLRSGRCNVTEAALEVGYSSVSHFTKAFLAETGRLPSDWRDPHL